MRGERRASHGAFFIVLQVASVTMILGKEQKLKCFTVKSRANREVQARFCERFGGEIPPYLLDFSSVRQVLYLD